MTLAKRHESKVGIPGKGEIRRCSMPRRGAPGRAVTAVFTGLRASELRGLRWCDVDFAAKLVRVRQRADTSGRIGSPKSASSRRDLPMAPMVINTLKEWVVASGSRDGLVFKGRATRPLCHNTLRDAIGRLHHTAISSRHG